MNRYLPSDRSLTRWDSMCSQGTGSRCSCSCPPSCQPVCPGPGPSPCPPICPGPGPAPCPPICPGPGPAPLSAPGPSRPSGPAPLAPLAPPARRVSLDLTVPLALPALRVFPVPHLSSKQKATSSNTTNKWQAYDKYYHKSAIYDFKLSRSCFKILQQGAYLIGSHRLPVRLIFQEIQAFFIII